jgi:hypothetical protein
LKVIPTNPPRKIENKIQKITATNNHCTSWT